MLCRRHDRSGFSLVEVLVALAILVFGVYAVYANFLDGSLKSRKQIDEVQAHFLAQQELEQLRACPYESLKHWQADPSPAPYFNQLKYFYLDKVTPRPDGALELTVQVGWDMRKDEPFKPGQSVTVKGLKTP